MKRNARHHGGGILPSGYKLTREIDKTRTVRSFGKKLPERLDRPESRPLDMQVARRKSRAKISLPKVTLA